LSDENEDRIEQIIEKYRGRKRSVIGLMQDVSKEYRYLPEDILKRLSRELEIPMAKLYGLATFYKSFRLDPIGNHHLCVCIGTACHVNGAQKLVDSLEREFHISAGETTEDNRLTLETVNCLGACAMGPLVVSDGEYHGKMDQNKLKKLVKKIKQPAQVHA
jgi:NADH:ubiquinone oxidoreductase subunit E